MSRARGVAAFSDVSAGALITSSAIVFFRIYKAQGIRGALRVIPIIWTIVWAVCGFARYHTAENERMSGNGNRRFEQARAIPEKEDKSYRNLGAWLRDRLHKLGPTFIKIGQTLSTRADLMPLSVMLELAKLQEDLEPFPSRLARQTIIAELGAAPEHLFRQFNTRPIAAASLCQAYKATLLDGRQVVVKVQRPGLVKTINADVQILEAVAQEVMKFPSLCRHTNWSGIVAEFAHTTMAETDYLKEGRNADIFRHNFRDLERIYVPRIIWRLTGRHVLTIEYVPGARITDADAVRALGIKPASITAMGAEFYLRQLLEDGFFHADPHPGNLRIMPDGKIGVFDFGMVGRVPKEIKQNMVSAFLHVISKDYRALIDDFVALGFLPATADCEALCTELAPLLYARFSDGISRVQFKKLLFDFSEIVYRYPFKLPIEFTYIMRALLTLEGLALSINPDFNFVAVALPFSRRLMIKSGAFRKTLVNKVFSEGRFNPAAAMKLLSTAISLV